ncbi:hypothetical protein CSUI_011273 [Cystoisospora suis]|uniref:Uncharacterized protein n=1 Tax=Cystoisospora suis TaxID=483139 RepID=A0A2C6KF17_9APIC|nr:hypothetical protein CSUI_011273 [Cystoisospora suis]
MVTRPQLSHSRTLLRERTVLHSWWSLASRPECCRRRGG